MRLGREIGEGKEEKEVGDRESRRVGSEGEEGGKKEEGRREEGKIEGEEKAMDG